MNDKPATADEQEDAAFRARLAPLASEVLPSLPNSLSRHPPRAGRRQAVIGLAGILAAVLGIVWWRSKWPQPSNLSHGAARTDLAPVEPATPPAQTSSEAMVGLLARRGDAALADGDIMGARLLFERAAALGSAAAATAAGKTYDIEFLLQAGARGIRADQAAATAWFRKAAALGDPEARARLARMEVQSRP